MMWTKINILLVTLWTSCYNTFVSGEPQVIGSSEPVLFREGEDVILPCHIDPPVDMKEQTVEWTRPDLKPVYVHLRQDGRYVFRYTNPLYKNRTSLFEEELTHGNISLKLYGVGLSDQGTYRCSAPNVVPHRYSEFRLIVAQEEIDIPPQGVLRLRPDYSSITSTSIRSILWKHGEISAAEWNKTTDSFTYYYKTFKNRAVLNTSTAELVINNMTTSDGGNYFVEINTQRLSKSFMVKVMKNVPKPEVTRLPCDSDSTSCEVKCILPGDITDYGPVTYRWKKDEGEWMVSDSGPNSNRLIVTRDEAGKVKTFTCEVKNVFSMERSDPERNRLYHEGTTPETTPTGAIVGGVFAALILAVGSMVLGVIFHDRIRRMFSCGPGAQDPNEG